MKKIEDVDNPEVGRFYLVPCVEDKLSGSGTLWHPVIGEWHEDKELGIARYHFHYDVRFFSEHRWLHNFPRWYGGPLGHMAQIYAGHYELSQTVKPEIHYRRLKMRRQMPDFPAEDLKGGTTKNNVVRTLENQFKGVKMKCMTCPHRGMSLKGLPVNDGMVVCNGHGLRWNVTTGEMVER